MPNFVYGTYNYDSPSGPIITQVETEYPQYKVLDASAAKHVNFPASPKGLGLVNCLYDNSEVVYYQDGKNIFTGEIYLLPLDTRKFPHLINIGQYLELVKVFVLTYTDTGNIQTGLFAGRKLEFIYPRYSIPLALIQGMIAREFNAPGTMFDVICPFDFDRLPVNGKDHSDVESSDTVLRGSEMASYKIPWKVPGTDFDIYKLARSVDWNKTLDGNNITRDEAIFCQLYKPGNKLTAYGGGGKSDWSYTGLDAAFDIVFGYVSGKL